jgi:hypothetical protein
LLTYLPAFKKSLESNHSLSFESRRPPRTCFLCGMTGALGFVMMADSGLQRDINHSPSLGADGSSRWEATAASQKFRNGVFFTLVPLSPGCPCASAQVVRTHEDARALAPIGRWRRSPPVISYGNHNPLIGLLHQNSGAGACSTFPRHFGPARGMTGKGHEERFPRRRLSGRCGFRKQSVAVDDQAT